MIGVQPESFAYARLKEHAAERSVLLQRLNETILEDSKVAAAWLYGSLARGDEDDLSDIDIRVVIGNEWMEQALSSRYEFMALVAEPLMILEAPQNRPPGGAFNMALYAGTVAPHQVDFTWSSSATTQIPTGVRVLHNPAGLPLSGEPMEFAYQSVPERSREEEIRQALHGFWSMLLIVGKYAARNPFEERMGLLQWTVPQLRGAQQFAGFLPGPPFEELEPVPEPAEKIGLLRTLAAEACALSERLAKKSVEPPVRFEPHARQYLDLVETVMLATTRERS